MPLNSDILTSALVAAYTTTQEVTTIDGATGKRSKKIITVSPDRATMSKLASSLVTHIQTFATVTPGIPVLAPPPAGTGSTTGPGKIL